MPHSSGTISFARRCEMQVKKTGKRPSRPQIYLKFHKPKEGKITNPESQKILDEIEKRTAILEENDDNSEVRDPLESIEGVILYEAFGPERNGRVRGMGYGVTPNIFSKANVVARQEKQQIIEENINLKEELAQVKKDLSDLKQQVEVLINIKYTSTQGDLNEDLI